MRICLLCLLMIAACKNHQSTTTNQVADSLISTMRNELASKYNAKDFTEARRYLDSIKPSIVEFNHPDLSSAWFAYKGKTFVRSDADSAKLYLDTAMHLAEANDHSKAKVIATIQFVSYYLEQKTLDSALKYALSALELSKNNPPVELPLLYSQLSFLYRAADDKINYRRYLFEGLRVSKEPMHIAALSSDIGRYYISRNELDSAEYFFKNFQQFNQFSAGYIDARKYDDLADLLFSMGKTKEGIRVMKQAIFLYGRENFKVPGNYLKIGAAYNDIGDLQSASDNIDTALLLARQTNDLENVSNSLFYKSTILRKKGRYDEGYQLLDSSYIYHLQYDTIAFRNQAKDLEAKIMARIKDEKISSLADAMKATQKLSDQRLLIIIILTISGILLICLGVLFVRRRRLQMQLKEAQFEQQSLRSQMEPHFIFNSLGTLQSYIRTGATAKSIDFLDKFSRLLRLSLDNSRKNAVSLKDEVAALDNYISLQSAQRNNGFDYFIETYQGFEKDEVMIPPMLIQPFVENAILHGFTNPKERGWVTIKITRQHQTLCCVIEDNGVGLNGTKYEDSKRSLSTAITKERLQLLSKQTGRKATIEIIDKHKTEYGKGVRVTLHIPIKCLPQHS